MALIIRFNSAQIAYHEIAFNENCEEYNTKKDPRWGGSFLK